MIQFAMLLVAVLPYVNWYAPPVPNPNLWETYEYAPVRTTPDSSAVKARYREINRQRKIEAEAKAAAAKERARQRQRFQNAPFAERADRLKAGQEKP